MFDNFLARLQMRIEKIILPMVVCKPLMSLKAKLLKFVDILNIPYQKRFPKFVLKTVIEGYTNKELADYHENNFKFRDEIFIYAEDYEISDIGDSCLWNGIYSAYDSIFKNGEYHYLYCNHIVRKMKDKYILLRGAEGNRFRHDGSGDQLTGFLFALSEQKRWRPSYINSQAIKFLDQFVSTRILYDENGEPAQFGSFNANPITINGDCIIFLTACAVVEDWKTFNKYYYDYNYKSMVSHGSVYLWDERWNGRRNWFSDNIALITLCTLFYELGKFQRQEQLEIGKAVMGILNNNKYRLWFWLLAVHVRAIPKEMIPQEAYDYFETFRLSTDKQDCPPFYNLGYQMADWNWQRSPFSTNQDHKWVSRIDQVFTQRLKEKYVGF